MPLLEGRVAVVTGATGIVGSGVASAFLAEGAAAVVAPARSAAGRAALLAELGAPPALDVPVCDYSTPEGAAALAVHLRQRFPQGVDVAVSSVGGAFTRGNLTELTPAAAHEALDRAVPHLTLAKELVPLMRTGAASAYVFVSGMLGEECSIPGAAALSLANAALYGIIRALEAELASKGSPLRVFELRIQALLRKDGGGAHPFVAAASGGKAFASSLVGAEAAALAAGARPGAVVRLRAADMEERERASAAESAAAL
jgi:NAD(P)-dependent dehydrogenase (short-subunit alcohol dehydrogenase family)